MSSRMRFQTLMVSDKIEGLEASDLPIGPNIGNQTMPTSIDGGGPGGI